MIVNARTLGQFSFTDAPAVDVTQAISFTDAPEVVTAKLAYQQSLYPPVPPKPPGMPAGWQGVYWPLWDYLVKVARGRARNAIQTVVNRPDLAGTTLSQLNVVDGTPVSVADIERLTGGADRGITAGEFVQLRPEVQQQALLHPATFLTWAVQHANPANDDMMSIGAEGGYSSWADAAWVDGVGLVPNPQKYMSVQTSMFDSPGELLVMGALGAMAGMAATAIVTGTAIGGAAAASTAGTELGFAGGGTIASEIGAAGAVPSAAAGAGTAAAGEAVAMPVDMAPSVAPSATLTESGQWMPLAETGTAAGTVPAVTPQGLPTFGPAEPIGPPTADVIQQIAVEPGAIAAPSVPASLPASVPQAAMPDVVQKIATTIGADPTKLAATVLTGYKLVSGQYVKTADATALQGVPAPTYTAANNYGVLPSGTEMLKQLAIPLLALGVALFS